MMDVDALRAKTKKEENYLLKDHLKETIQRASQLKEFVSKNYSAFEYNFTDDFFKNLIIACFLHDLGKIEWNFQWKLYDHSEKEYDPQNRAYKSEELNQLRDFFSEILKINVKDHEVISLLYSLIFLPDDSWSEKIRSAILLHHYNEFYTNRAIHAREIFTEYPDLEKYAEFLINHKAEAKNLLVSLLQYLEEKTIEGFTKSVLRDLFSKLDNNFLERIEQLKGCIDNGYGLSTVLRLYDIPDRDKKDSYEFFVFLGCLRRCDYSASGDVGIEEIVNLEKEVYGNLDEKIKQKIGRKEIWQEKALKEAKGDDLILIAPTGSGKTEFALLWAEKMGRKLVYTLPLRVALNDLYWRFSASENGYFQSKFVRILHSTSFIEYLKKEDGGSSGKEMSVDEMQTTARLFSSPVVLTTPDQVFLSGLKYYGFDKLLSVYPLSCIVIDEIQAYNPEMAAVIIKTLEIIKSLSGKVLVLTATFPPYFKGFLKDFEILDKEDKSIKNYNLKRHRVALVDDQIFEYRSGGKDRSLDIKCFDKILEKLDENKDKNIMIIVNNVGKAIKLYRQIEEELAKQGITKKDPEEELNLYLLHSRLIEKEKSRRIDEIKGKLDKSEGRVIVVATQIVEASVDVDFDILITEISPIDSQIQRWGRVYRNREKDYAEESPNIYIFTGVDRGTKAIYDKGVIEKTIEALEALKEDADGLLDYQRERRLIDYTFKHEIDGGTLEEKYVEEIKKNLDWLNYYSIEKRSEAQRIFRKIAGLQVVIPALMKDSKDPIEKIMYDILMDKEKREFSWEKIIDSIKASAGLNVEKWRLMSVLYENSINLPLFAIWEDEYARSGVLEREPFKGFFILKDEKLLGKLEEMLEEIRRYGINEIGDLISDMDWKEIELSERVM